MAETIDSLQIEINAKATKANDAIDRLVGKLDRLTTSLSRVNGTNLNGLANGVQRLGTAMQTMNTIKTADFTRLATNLTKLGSVNVSALNSAASSMSHLTRAMSAFSGVSFDNKNLLNMINSITRLSNSNVQSLASVDFSRLGISINQLATSLSNAPKIQQSVISMTNAIANLAKSGQNIPIVASSLGSLGQSMNTFMASVSSAPNVSENVISFAQAVGLLANSGAKAGITAKNLSALGVGLRNLMATLSRSPQVSQNIIQMTNALANLASQGSKVGSASRNLVGGLNNSSRAAVRAKKNFGGLASAIGKFYATYFMVIRGLKGLWKSIESTADYIEAYNYYTVSFGKIASKWDSEWENYGDENARNYGNSFVTTMNETFKKLSGVSYDPQTGLISETGLKNLGLNLQEVTQYAAQLASMMDAVGQSGETTLATTNAFVKLAGDISSLYNIDYSEAAKKIRSVLQGQSRAGYGFGWDTTMASLQATADKLNLSKAVSEMSQMEKQQLRILTILDQSRVAWGDQSNTINTLANQIRLFKNNIKEAGMILGQLFVPILAEIMPIINGITIAIKNLMTSIATMLGIKIKDIGQGFTDRKDDIDGITDSYEEATKAAEEYKNQLLGFDEVNKLSESSDSASGAGNIDLTQQILEATSEYQKVWQEAYDKMQSRAEKFAQKITRGFKNVLSALKPLEAPLNNLVGVFEKLTEFGKELGIDVYENFLKPIGEWELNENIPVLSSTLKEIADGVDWEKLGDTAGKTLSLMANSIITINSTLTKLAKEILPILVPIFNELVGILNIALDNINKTWNLIDKYIMPVLEATLIPALKLVGEAILLVVSDIKEMMQGWNDFVDDVSAGDWESAWNDISDTFKRIWDNLVSFASNKCYSIKSIFEGVANTAKNVFDKSVFKKPLNGIIELFEKMANGVIDAWNKVIDTINKVGQVKVGNIEFGGFNIGKGNHISIPRFIAGGYPEDGLFYKNSDEVITQVGGKTQVLNREDTHSMIKQAAYEGMLMAMSQSSNNTNVNVILQGDADGLFRAVQDKANNYTAQTGRPAFNI